MKNPIQELTFEEYHQRQQLEITGERLMARAADLRSTNKFKRKDDAWQKVPYKGYAIVSMVDTNPGNTTIARQLVSMQQAIMDAVENSTEHFFVLPPASFHQTVANTLSSHRFKTHVEDKGLESQYPHLIASAFQQIPTPDETTPIEMTLSGLSIFGSALGILGTFASRGDYQRILDFRDRIYHNPELAQLDIKRTRQFIGHLTMLYIDGVLHESQKMQLVKACVQLNREIQKNPPEFLIYQTGLRHYRDLSHFRTEAHYPVFNFVSPQNPKL